MTTPNDPAPALEPRAWMIFDHVNVSYFTTFKEAEAQAYAADDTFTVTPLYATPAPEARAPSEREQALEKQNATQAQTIAELIEVIGQETGWSWADLDDARRKARRTLAARTPSPSETQEVERADR